jgi:hypothetical protein
LFGQIDGFAQYVQDLEVTCNCGVVEIILSFGGAFRAKGPLSIENTFEDATADLSDGSGGISQQKLAAEIGRETSHRATKSASSPRNIQQAGPRVQVT